MAVLMSEGQLSLAGLGTFRLVDQAASINIIEGQVKPPGKKAVFNANLSLDDGRLLRYWMRQKGLTQEEAQKQVSELCAFIQDELAKGSSVQILGLGRLFKDHKQEINFTASEQNLATSSFGLATVPIAPVVRTERPAAYPSATNTAGSNIPPPSTLPSIASSSPLARLWLFAHTYIWHIAAATAVLFLLGLWYLNARDTRSATPLASRQAEEQPLAVPPPSPDPSLSSGSLGERHPPEAPIHEISNNNEEEEAERDVEEASTSITSPRPTAPAIGKSAIIAVGRYGKAANVNKMVERIEAAGYVAYTKDENGLTRVGVRYNYANENKLDEVLTDVRRRFSQDAFILSRHKSEQ